MEFQYDYVAAEKLLEHLKKRFVEKNIPIEKIEEFFGLTIAESSTGFYDVYDKDGNIIAPWVSELQIYQAICSSLKRPVKHMIHRAREQSEEEEKRNEELHQKLLEEEKEARKNARYDRADSPIRICENCRRYYSPRYVHRCTKKFIEGI